MAGGGEGKGELIQIMLFFTALWKFIWLMPYALLLRPLSVAFVFMSHFNKARARRLWEDMG